MKPLRTTIAELIQPLNLAAYATWAAVLMALLEEVEPGAAAPPSLVGLMVAFLVAFVTPHFLPAGAAMRRAEYACFAAQSILALAVIALSRSTTAPVLVVIVMGQWAMILPGLALCLVGLVLNAGVMAVFLLNWSGTKPWLVGTIYGGFQLFAILTAVYARRAEANAERLTQVNAQLLATRSLLEESARGQERVRLARELHDVAGHKLTALKLNLALLERDPNVDTAATLRTATQLAGELLDDLRGVVAQMRQHDGMDLRGAIEQLAAPIPRPRIVLDLADDARVRHVHQAEALVRAAQEGLTNAVRHAQASEVRVGLHLDGNHIVLTVRDNGRGGEIREGNGLKGMRERISLLGGTVRVGPAEGGGHALEVRIPVSTDTA
ncbi:sensor histidine kinase [Tahibacter amnicola]|uniref:Sensor histidine kinase n=1 Tax=Tahibacter amnicola TaxID=2976241 RepID=A0ABY6BH40_9GAMM|nr:sensor histidine kinase [Tahibacter amnicola]UXI68390.1 sensor histidine kinase [Tahibacter amnicola]